MKQLQPLETVRQQLQLQSARCNDHCILEHGSNALAPRAWWFHMLPRYMPSDELVLCLKSCRCRCERAANFRLEEAIADLPGHWLVQAQVVLVIPLSPHEPSTSAKGPFSSSYQPSVEEACPSYSSVAEAVFQD